MIHDTYDHNYDVFVRLLKDTMLMEPVCLECMPESTYGSESEHLEQTHRLKFHFSTDWKHDRTRPIFQGASKLRLVLYASMPVKDR